MSDEKRKQARDFGDGFRAGYLAALEDAAKACEDVDGYGRTSADAIQRCASAVRALGE